jgi:hypothetical protein
LNSGTNNLNKLDANSMGWVHIGSNVFKEYDIINQLKEYDIDASNNKMKVQETCPGENKNKFTFCDTFTRQNKNGADCSQHSKLKYFF